MEIEQNMDKSHMPSVEELQNRHEEELRIKILKQLDLYNVSNIKQEGLFYKTFRRFEDLDCNTYNTYNTYKNENIYYKKYKNYIEKETSKKSKKIEKIENRIEYEKFFLSWERRISSENNGGYYKSNVATRYRVDLIQRLERKLEIILEESLEAWEFYYKRQLIRDIENQREQRLVEVSYVVEAKCKIIESLKLGTPVYIIGHLGSGKTQLASEAALDFTVQNKIQREIESEMEDWYSLNKDATENDAIEKFGEINKKKKIYYKNILTNGSKEEIESLQPLFISGSHNLTYEDMFVEKTLSLKHSFSQGSFIDYLNLIVEDFYEWLDGHKDKLEKMSDEEQLQLKIQIWKSFSDLLVESNSAFGTEIKKIEREILIAVKQGRPVIVDELNTIAMQNLIALNDILQQHAGNTAYITGVGPVLIQPGFAFIGTGNLSTQMVNYEGTNELNPAFKSRFMTLEYNYLAQNIVGEMEKQEFPEKNELFRIILTKLADENGNIQIPNARKTVEELFKFSQLSKLTQNIFMGKWTENEDEKDVMMGKLELKESVLSIRNILHVLNTWNLGEEKDLSKALWDGFISSITYSDDQNYIISQAVRFGFFSSSEGWSIEHKGLGKPTTTYDEIRSRPYNYKRPSMEMLSYLDLVHLIFGKRKDIEKLQKGFLEYLKYEVKDSQQIDVKKFQELDQIISHLEHTSSLIDYLEDNGVEE